MNTCTCLWFVLITVLTSYGSLQATFENHLRKVTHKEGNHQIRNVDFIYMINLDERPQKYASCVKQLEPYDIHPCRFSAINGWLLSPEELNDLGVIIQPGMRQDLSGSYNPMDGGNVRYEYTNRLGQSYFCYDLGRGAIGCMLSHLSVLCDAYDSGYETIRVMEDDIEVIQNPHIVSDRIDRLDALVGHDGWDILFTDKDTKNEDGVYVPCYQHLPRPNFTPRDRMSFSVRWPIDEVFLKIGSRFGAYSMILRRSGIKKILEFFKTYAIFAPYDIDCFLAEDMRTFSLLSAIVSTQPKAPTDIQVTRTARSDNPGNEV